ncbi:copper chaperone PCu(A)C [Novosphingobium flavum]|uniref:Copper chaperone PCu(A)C n=1 Tax=Novosphingobium flavum TaxID=1778672 RepID=A0A7X1FPX0_9SPHN|nr:copper chaperone PCu(A)C [Novosphingobium flavum]MBC2664703.1 copper chaperone PCu(A)C [Novosphingobium flavum]
MNRFSRPLAFGLAALALPLAACRQNGAAPETVQTSESAPEAKPGLSLGGGRLILPAVSGNPAAAYFSLTNGSDKAVTLAAVDVAGAGMAMMHQTMETSGHSTMGEMKQDEVKPGETLVFAPGGKHVMVSDLPAGLKPGGTIEITLIFADGDKLSAPLTIEAPGGGA